MGVQFIARRGPRGQDAAVKGLTALPAGACRMTGAPDEIHVKHTYWICTDDGAAGNPIDLLMRIRNLSFNQAMELLRS